MGIFAPQVPPMVANNADDNAEHPGTQGSRLGEFTEPAVRDQKYVLHHVVQGGRNYAQPAGIAPHEVGVIVVKGIEVGQLRLYALRRQGRRSNLASSSTDLHHPF